MIRMLRRTALARLRRHGAGAPPAIGAAAGAASSTPSRPPRDVAYPGGMTLDIDATDTERGIYRVTQTIPVARRGRD